MADQVLPAMRPVPDGIQCTIPPREGDHQNDLYISHDNETELEHHLLQQLETKGFKCLRKEVDPGQSEFECLDDCCKIIAVINRTYMDNNLNEFEAINARAASVEERKVVLIPIIHNIPPNEVPAYIKEVNYLLTDDPEFWKKFLKALTTEPYPINPVPAGDIAEGLAWQYYYNYLALKLPGFHERALDNQRFFHNKDGIRMLAKFVILLPMTCIAPNDISKIDDNVKMGKEDYLRFTLKYAGTNRKYDTAVLTVTDPDDDTVKYYVPMEFATPLVTMRDMEMGRISGLGQQEKVEQTKKFKETLETIFERADLQKHAVLLEYDDRSQDQHALSRAVVALVNRELGIKAMAH